MALSFSYTEIILAFIGFMWLWGLSKLKQPIWNWPFVGMLPSLLLHVHHIHDRCANLLEWRGGTMLFKGPWFVNMHILLTIDPANVHYIMSSNFTNYPKGSEFKKMFEILGDGIFNSDSEAWKDQRKLSRELIAHHMFQKCLIKTTLSKLETGLVPILEHVSQNGVTIDLQDVFKRFTFDTTCILVTGYDPGCLSIEFPDVPFANTMDEAEEAIFMRHCLPESVWKFQRWLNFGHEKKLREGHATLDRVICQYISMKRVEMTKMSKDDNEEGFDLLTSYLKQNETTLGGKNFDDKYLRDTIINLMLAGRDTTSSALTWFIWLVSTHPEVQEKIREELTRAIIINSAPTKETKQWRLFQIHEVRNLVYLHAALCESLRLYPPVPFQHKAPIQSDILPTGHKVDPKTKIVFSLYAMGRNSSIWGNDCFEFKPERWISESGRIKHEPSYKFLAFNAGPRTCLGKDVAFTQMKATAADIIHNYQVRAEEGHCVSPNVSIILYMKHGFKAKVNKRWN
ncbi:oxygenase [Lithospermum erythrorhizon]|uniref:Oxygenase n=1 Tax=Lithospermum erythrorhizon TaxID=34254 RepID=A0AAV3QRW5_LITER